MKALVIGAGAAGGIHARELLARGLDVAVWDVDGARANALADKAGASIAADCGVPCDLSVIAAPTRFHDDYIRDQLGCDDGRAVVCEKPLVLQPGDAADITDAIEIGEPGFERLYIAESQAYGNKLIETKQMIESGGLGDGPVMWSVALMSAYRSQAWSYELGVGGGAFLEGGAHLCTVAAYLFGESEHHSGEFVAHIGDAPDTGTLTIRYKAGHILSLEICWGTHGVQARTCPLPANRCLLIGSEKAVQYMTGDHHGLMWDQLLPAIDAGRPAHVTPLHAAQAVRDVWACYAAGGVACD